jgi:hypothetical protein
MKGLTVPSLFIELRDPNSTPYYLVSKGPIWAPIVQSNPSAKIWKIRSSNSAPEGPL